VVSGFRTSTAAYRAPVHTEAQVWLSLPAHVHPASARGGVTLRSTPKRRDGAGMLGAVLPEEVAPEPMARVGWQPGGLGIPHSRFGVCSTPKIAEMAAPGLVAGRDKSATPPVNRRS